MKILIAEDDVTSITLLANVLKNIGHEVVETTRGTEAWEKFQEPDAPRLAILDWMMPEMDGVEVVRRVRSLQTDRPPYLILLTARGKKTDIIAGLESGADDYLAKPFDIGELRARVEVGRRMIEMQDTLIRSREALAHQATHDPLTGMLNRRAILDHLQKELVRAGRHANALAVGICDVDHFKQINDTYGHQTGDDVLCGLSKILAESLREYDFVGRMGGEEFLLITPLRMENDCLFLFERLRRKIADSRIATRSGEVTVTVSIGVAYAVDGSSVDVILEAADRALYQAKNDGRNRVAKQGHCFSVENRT